MFSIDRGNSAVENSYAPAAMTSYAERKMPAPLDACSPIGRRLSQLCLMVLACAISSCSTYEAPAVNHTYVTNTQDYHNLSGLRIYAYPYRGSGADYLTGLAVGVREFQEIFVDGRTVLSTNGFKPVETFLQLPPGQHELLVTEKLKGKLTLDTNVETGPKSRVQFTLGRGATATLVTEGALVSSLQGVETYAVVEGPQILGSSIVNASAPSVRPERATVEAQLAQLKELRDKGLVSAETYQQRVGEILKQLQ